MQMMSSNYSWEERTRVVERVLATATGVEPGMGTLLAYCAEVYPWNGWRDLQRLDYAKDLTVLSDWLESLLASEPPGASIVAFWFGLFDSSRDEETVPVLYLSGSPWLDRENPDWPCWIEGSYIPEGRYIDSQVLQEIYRHVSQEHEDDEIKRLGENILCLGYAGLAVQFLCQAVPRAEAYGPRMVGVGYDEGQPVVLGTVAELRSRRH